LNPSPASHDVHFFRSDAQGDAALAEFVGEGLSRGDDVLVFATPRRTAAVRERLGVLADAPHLTFADAQETTHAIIIDGALDRRRLSELILPFISQSTRPKRIYGEMVALLAAGDQLDAALELERAGQELAHDLGVQVLCGYHHPEARAFAPDAVSRIVGHHDEARVDQALGTVLLADDYEDTRDLFGEYLSFKGYEVILACDGVEALEKARAHVPDVLLLDVRMPRMTGTEAMAALKADPRFAGVPVVALTAHALDYERDALLSAGFDAVVTKPCLPDALAEIVASFVNRCRA
jgi:CheY-like chemotaxis protein